MWFQPIHCISLTNLSPQSAKLSAAFSKNLALCLHHNHFPFVHIIPHSFLPPLFIQLSFHSISWPEQTSLSDCQGYPFRNAGWLQNSRRLSKSTGRPSQGDLKCLMQVCGCVLTRVGGSPPISLHTGYLLLVMVTLLAHGRRGVMMEDGAR